MKIGNTGAAPAMAPAGGISATPRETGEAAKAGPSTATASTEGSTTVKISRAATDLLEGSEGGFDAEKVSRIRQSISDGTYKIDAGAIADKLISNAQDLLGKTGSVS